MNLTDREMYNPPAPNFFSGKGDVVVTRANLPHWNKSRIATFVTFRLADSLPEERLVQLRDEKEDWMSEHPQPWTDDVAEDFHRRFGGAFQDALDSGHGACVLRQESCRKIVEDCIWHFAGERYALYAYVVMPNHVHVLLMPLDDWRVREIVESIKKFTARRINEVLGKRGALWQKESYDTLMRNERQFRAVVRYIRKNDLSKSWAYSERRSPDKVGAVS